MYHVAHFVKFTTDVNGDGELEDYDALVPGKVTDGQTLPLLYAIQGAQVERHEDIPHGDSSKGNTWH